MPKVTNKETNKRERLVLLDTHAILHRAYHALPDFTSPTGEPTGGLYGLVSMLLRIVSDLKPDYIAACYDLPKPTYRHEAYEGYKAGRKKADEDLVQQIKRSRDVLAAFNIPIFEAEGFEADDLLGTIVEQVAQNKKLEVVIASGDMDTLQLVTGDRVRVYTLKKGIKDTVLYDETGVHERFGFGPALLPDFKGLRGDPSDNIIGIAGIGEKTATELITKFGGIDALYAALKKDVGAFKKAGFSDRIVKLLEEGEEEAQFSRMLGLIRRDAPISFTLPPTKWRESASPERVVGILNELGFRSLVPRVQTFFGGAGQTPLALSTKEETTPVDPDLLRRASIALWVLHSDMTTPSLEDILRDTKTKTLPDAFQQIIKELERHNLLKVYTDIEEPLIPVVQKMEERGVLIDTAYLKKLSVEYHKELDLIERSIWKTAGKEFNVSSPKQLADVLFDTLGLKGKKRTATGQRSTRESELEKLKGEHPIIGEILRYRELQKLLGTYIDNLPALVEKDGRLHATFLQAGTTTGRMASQNPNLQNIPIKTETGRAIRNAFVADKGSVLAAFDYSQIELRIAAFLSGDPKLVEVFKSGGDIHTAVASEIFDVPPERVDASMRRKAKVINFGILYGMGVTALGAAAEISRSEAQEFLEKYYREFPVLADYVRRVKGEARKKGYAETFFGRRRYLPGITSRIPYIVAEAERMAVNAPMQGTQADLIKIAMVRIQAYLEKSGYAKRVALLLQIHDELIYEIETDIVADVAPEIKKIMESVLTTKETNGVPIVTGLAIGKTWGTLEISH